MSKDFIKISIISISCVLFFFLSTYNVGLNLMDEGYVWYGTWRTSLGELPIRDFVSYDLGRYYWGAVWMWIFDDGLITFRFGNTILIIIAVIFGMMVLKKVIHSWLLLTLMATVLIMWMYHTDRAIGYFIAIMTVYVGSILIEKPTPKLYLISGIFVGLAAFFGQNYGVYTLLIFLLLSLFIWHSGNHRPILKRLIIFFAGVVIGYSPTLIVMAVDPEFFHAFINHVKFLLERGATNIPKPVPWPWSYILSELSWVSTLIVYSRGGFFIFILLIPLIIVIHLVRSFDRNDKRYAPLISALITSIVFSHYAFSRPDLTHLADSILPFLILVFIYPAFIKSSYGRYMGQILVISVILMSLIISIVIRAPFSQYFFPDQYVKIDIRGDDIWLNKSTAGKIVSFRNIVNKVVKEDESILFAPYLPGMYPILGRKSPLKTTYFLFPIEDQHEMIKKLESENVNWAIISTNIVIDGNKDLSFQNSFPILNEYIIENFQFGRVKGFPKGFYLLGRKSRLELK